MKRESGLTSRALPIALGLAMSLLASCGLLSKDIPVSAQFTIGGFPPNSIASLNTAQLTSPLEASAGDLSKISSVTMTSAQLSSTDGMDLSFITGGTITLSGNGLPDVQLATLSPPGTVGVANYTIVSSIDLKPYLEAGGSIGVTITYGSPPVPARGLELNLNLHASL